MKMKLAVLAAASALVASPGAAQAGPELGHWMVAISVADLDAETAFFEKLGFKVELDTTFGPQIPVRWLVSGNERIELLKIANSQPGAPRAKPPGHAAVQGISQVTLSTSDIEATRAALAADASALYARNLYNFLSAFWDKEQGKPVLDEEIGNAVRLTQGGAVVSDRLLG